MKKNIVLLTVFCCVLASTAAKNVPVPAKYESFENGIPKSWVLQGKGKLSINPWHYKLGKKSLQWDFSAGDAIRINNTIGNIKARGGRSNACFATFGMWIYNKKARPGKSLRIEFRVGEKVPAYVDFPLNYDGWQCAFLQYINSSSSVHKKTFVGTVSPDTDNILIKAPKDISGTVLIDCVVYNGLSYYWNNFLPRKKPWQPTKLDENKYPVPKTVSAADSKAIERVKKQLLPQLRITKNDSRSAQYKQLIKNFKDFNIVEDSHGIRGVPIQLPRGMYAAYFDAPMFTANGIPRRELNGFTDLVVTGDRSNKWKKGIVKRLIKCLAKGVSQAQYNAICREYLTFWKYLIDQGFNPIYGDRVYYTTCTMSCFEASYLTRDIFFKHERIRKQIVDFLQCPLYDLFSTNENMISMDYFAGSSGYYTQAFLYSDKVKKQVQILRFLADRMSNEITGDYGSCGFKPDGCGYHCTAFSHDYMINGLRGIAKVALAVSGSSFALSNEAYSRLKLVALRMYFYTNSCFWPIFMQGTHPLTKQYVCRWMPEIIRNLALAGKNGCDEELAQAYVNLKADILKRKKDKSDPFRTCKYDPVFEKKYGFKPANPPQGNISMPYGPLMAQRRAEWVAVAWSGPLDMRDRGNQYMYHGGHGPLSILGRGGLFSSGSSPEGWDWNRINGTTCLYMPDLINIKYKHTGRKVPKGKKVLANLLERQRRTDKNHPIIKRGDGGLSWRGVNGCFRSTFRGDKLYNDFSGKKSYFFINDRIYALGSNISSDNKKYHAQTNIYQKLLNTKNTPTFVDGKKVTAFPLADKMLDAKKAHYLIDAVGNGYFIPAKQKVFVARKSQKSRISYYKKHKDSVADYATAWLEHGVACKDAKYSYVIMPYCDKAKLAKFSNKDYEILQQDAQAHILHDKINGFYAGIFFAGGDVTKLPHVANVERDCQIMYKENNGKLEIAVGDPDVHRHWTDKLVFGQYGGKSTLTPLKVTFAGSWKLAGPVAGVKILSSGKGRTVMEFACIHGKDFNFTLVK